MPLRTNLSTKRNHAAGGEKQIPCFARNDVRPLTSADVKATFDFILNPKNASPKRGAFRLVAGIDTPDPLTVVFHLSEPYASFPTNYLLRGYALHCCRCCPAKS